ncbi:MAG TPA: ABC transporter permease [Alphaproteobacteria bacterium]|nr:ABC transporter permease [Alphaproteobacteria bacterium]
MTTTSLQLGSAGNLAQRAAARRERGLAALSLPALVLLGVLFAYPVLRLMALSIAGGSLHWYAKALGEGLYLEVYGITFRIAAIVTAVAFLLSYPLAYFLATTTRGWRTLGFVFVLLPLWTSILVRTYAWMVLLGRNGVLNKILLDLGLIRAPLALLYNELGVIIGMVHVLMPYMVLPIYSAMMRLDPSLVQAARGLGAPGWRIFLRIYLPLTAQGIFAGGILVFVLSLGFFITPALLGGGRVMMIAVLIEQQVREVLDWSFAGALSTVLLVATIAIYGIAQRLARGREERA